MTIPGDIRCAKSYTLYRAGLHREWRLESPVAPAQEDEGVMRGGVSDTNEQIGDRVGVEIGDLQGVRVIANDVMRRIRKGSVRRAKQQMHPARNSAPFLLQDGKIRHTVTIEVGRGDLDGESIIDPQGAVREEIRRLDRKAGEHELGYEQGSKDPPNPQMARHHSSLARDRETRLAASIAHGDGKWRELFAPTAHVISHQHHQPHAAITDLCMSCSCSAVSAVRVAEC